MTFFSWTSKESSWVTNQSQLLPNSTSLKIYCPARSIKYKFWQSVVGSSVSVQKLLAEQVIRTSWFIYTSLSQISLNTWTICISWFWKDSSKVRTQDVYASFFLIHALYVNLKFIIIMWPWFVIRILNQNAGCFPQSVFCGNTWCFIVIKFFNSQSQGSYCRIWSEYTLLNSRPNLACSL